MSQRVKYRYRTPDGTNFLLVWCDSRDLTWEVIDMWGVNEDVTEKDFREVVNGNCKYYTRKDNTKRYRGTQYPGDRWGIMIGEESNEFGPVSP